MHNHQSYALLVSGDLSTVQAISQVLTLGDYHISTAATWSDVMRDLQCLPLSVILYDLMELDDEERKRLQVLRREQPDIPVVLLPSLDTPELSRAVAEELIANYLVKPLHLTSLLECVHRLAAERETAWRQPHGSYFGEEKGGDEAKNDKLARGA